MHKLRKKQGIAPNVLLSDNLPLCGADERELGLPAPYEQGS
jgi:hypothetical protein